MNRLKLAIIAALAVTTGVATTMLVPTRVEASAPDLCCNHLYCDSAGACHIGSPLQYCEVVGTTCTSQFCDSNPGCQN